MVDQEKVRVENMLQKVIDDIDKTHLRKMQADMHRCAAECCDNTIYSMEQTHNCVEHCSERLQGARNYVRTELENFQYRLQRCVLQCNDDVKDKLGANPTEAEIEKCSKEFESCAVVCVDKHIGIIPNFVRKMKEVLAKGSIPTSTSIN